MKKTGNKNIKYQTEEQKEMIHFILVLVVIVVFVIGVYFISKMFIVDKSLFEIAYTDGTINSERAIVGTIFNRPEDEYYVMVYHEDSEKAIYYSTISSNYVSKQENALAVYHVDLSHSFNKDYYVGSEGVSNSKATKVSEFKFKDLTLLRIKKGKIVKYLEDEEVIKKELTITKEKES